LVVIPTAVRNPQVAGREPSVGTMRIPRSARNDHGASPSSDGILNALTDRTAYDGDNRTRR
jgi:hypothetical protein